VISAKYVSFRILINKIFLQISLALNKLTMINLLNMIVMSILFKTLKFSYAREFDLFR